MADSPVLGGELLRLVTAGMYDDPLILYREYVQNAADAIVAQGSGTGLRADHDRPAELPNHNSG